MHDIRFIRDNPEAFDRGLARRGLPPQAQRLIALDETRRAAIQKAEGAQARRNAASKEIGEAKKNKDEAKAKDLMAEVAMLKELIPRMEAEEKSASKTLNDALAEIPNSAARRSARRQGRKGQRRASSFRSQARLRRLRPSSISNSAKRLARWILRAAAKLSGARFVVLKKGIARLERALGQFFLDVHTSERIATPKSRRRSWCAMRSCLVPRNCRNLREDQFSASRKLTPNEGRARLCTCVAKIMVMILTDRKSAYFERIEMDAGEEKTLCY